MTKHVVLVHGDFLTKERLDTVRNSRWIEYTPKNQFQYVIFLPGLFHYKMACADALWHTHIQPKEGHDDENSLYQHIGILRPDEMGKMVSKAGFRHVHDVLHHDVWASMLDCWWIEAHHQNMACATLEKFAESEPTWDVTVTCKTVTMFGTFSVYKLWRLYVWESHFMLVRDIGEPTPGYTWTPGSRDLAQGM
jgi:hypothetical protein